MTPYIVLAAASLIWAYLYAVACLNYRDLWTAMINYRRKHAALMNRIHRLRQENDTLRAVIAEHGWSCAIVTQGLREHSPIEDDSVDATRPQSPAGPRVIRHAARTTKVLVNRFWAGMREFI